MVQAAVLDGQFFDPAPPFDDGGVAAEVGVGGRDVADTLVVAVVVIVIDESADLAFKVLRQIIVFQQDAVLQRLMPALDLALCLRVVHLTDWGFDFQLVPPGIGPKALKRRTLR